MHPKKTLLRNLLSRLEADASSSKPQFRGIVSDMERNALRLLLTETGIIEPLEEN